MKRYRTYALKGRRTYPEALGAIIGYIDSPIRHIGEHVKNFTDFVKNIYNVCEIQGHFSVICSHMYEDIHFTHRDVIMSEKIDIIPYMWRHKLHIFQIVEQELFSTYCGNDNRCNNVYSDYTGCIIHESVDTNKPSIRFEKTFYLVIDTNDNKIRVMSDIALKDNGLI